MTKTIPKKKKCKKPKWLYEDALQIVEKKEKSESCSVVSASLRTHDYNLGDYSVHRILQARILESIAISSSRGSCQEYFLINPSEWCLPFIIDLVIQQVSTILPDSSWLYTGGDEQIQGIRSGSQSA